MRLVILAWTAVLCGGLMACSGSESIEAPDRANAHAATLNTASPIDTDGRNADDEYLGMLLEKAQQLAEREIARMSAAELLYRNTPTVHRIENAIIGSNVGVHTKIYRSFNDYEVTDIVRSESYLNPVTFEITYAYDLLATEPRSITTPNAERLSHADVQFSVIATQKLTRQYPANAHGELAGRLPETLPRPDFFKRDAEHTEMNLETAAPAAPMLMTPPTGPTGALGPAGMPSGMPPGGPAAMPNVRMIDPPTGPLPPSEQK